MNIDHLKTAWEEYGRKLQSTRLLNERIILSMITERSGNRFSKVRRGYQLGLLWMFVCFSFAILVIMTNPFDYRYTIQYVPMVIFAVGLSILIADMGRSYVTFQKISVTHYNVDDSLKRIIAVYEKPKKFLRYTIIVFLFSQVVFFPLSFLPPMIDRMGLGPAIAERLIPIFIGAAMLYIAYKLGAFKERHADKFKEDLNELESLKKMSAELDESGE